MNNKEYKDYHVLDEEIEDLDTQQEDENIYNEAKSEKTGDKEEAETKAEETTSDIIDVEIIDTPDQVPINNKAQVIVYTPVLTEEESLEDTYQDIYKEDIQNNQRNLYEEKVNKEQEQTEYKSEQQETTKDTSFTSYVEADKKRERSFLAKWSIRLAKLILFIMLLPVIGIVGGGILAVAGGVAFGILTCICGGIFILGTTCFIATQVNAMVIALGISVGITTISFGLIVLSLCIMLIKKVIQLIHKGRIIKKNKEVR